MISYQGAFDPTKMWWSGRMLGASISEPIATCTYWPSRTTENRKQPHDRQRVSLASGSPNTARLL